MKLIDMKQEYAAHTNAAERIWLNAATEKRDYTAKEQQEYDAHLLHAKELQKQISVVEAKNTIVRNIGGDFTKLLGGGAAPAERGQTQMSPEYSESFLAFLRSGGMQTSSALSEGFDPMFGGFALPALQGMSAALYEGSSGAGGAAVNVPTDGQIIPLAVPDLGPFGGKGNSHGYGHQTPKPIHVRDGRSQGRKRRVNQHILREQSNAVSDNAIRVHDGLDAYRLLGTVAGCQSLPDVRRYRSPQRRCHC